MERHVRKSEKIVGGEERKGGAVREEGRVETGQGGAAEMKSKGSKSGQRAGGRVGGEVKG